MQLGEPGRQGVPANGDLAPDRPSEHLVAGQPGDHHKQRRGLPQLDVQEGVDQLLPGQQLGIQCPLERAATTRTEGGQCHSQRDVRADYSACVRCGRCEVVLLRGTLEFRCDDAPEDLRSLAQWLQAGHELRGCMRLVHGEIQPGEMGGALDVLAVALSTGGTATVLVRSLFAWLGTRRRPSSVHLKLKRPDGHEAELEVDCIRDPDAVIDKLSQFFSDE